MPYAPWTTVLCPRPGPAAGPAVTQPGHDSYFLIVSPPETTRCFTVRVTVAQPLKTVTALST